MWGCYIQSKPRYPDRGQVNMQDQGDYPHPQTESQPDNPENPRWQDNQTATSHCPVNPRQESRKKPKNDPCCLRPTHNGKQNHNFHPKSTLVEAAWSATATVAQPDEAETTPTSGYRLLGEPRADEVQSTVEFTVWSVETFAGS